ncbi:ABC transporter permease [Thermococcus sp. M36]|uniref:ABC transporter permease n=1 Tax=Thermococcus sp. M36 TaxID=1638261 RepID=UPI00143ACC92|nr:ABC transporter permease [Thermococcus sp. M36]NJE05607.1 ABC transporter permease [Thermococcus sp. M36]
MNRRKVGVLILVLFFTFTAVSYATLDRVKLDNWDNYLFWVDYPRGAKPVWLGDSSKTVAFRGGVDYTVVEKAPSNLILRGKGEVSITIFRPDGRVVHLRGEINGTASVNSNVDLVLQARRFAIEELGLRRDDMAFITPTQALFMDENREPLRGTYTVQVYPSGVEAVIVGDTYGLLGTDYKGRDLWVGFVGSTVNTLVLAFLTTLFVIFLGIFLGVASGYYESKFGDAVSVVLEALNSIPYLPLAIAVVFVLSSTGPHGKLKMGTVELAVILAMLLVGKFASAVRGIVMHEKVQEYIESARALGAGDLAIILRHIMRAVVPYALSYSTLLFAQMIAVISILGLFQIIPGVNWGSFVAEAFAQNAIYTLWWWPLSPSVAIVLLSVGLTLLSKTSSD